MKQHNTARIGSNSVEIILISKSWRVCRRRTKLNNMTLKVHANKTIGPEPKQQAMVG